MSKKKLPYFPLFLGDLIVATPRPAWKGPHRALYTILLAHQWFYGCIPREPEAIADMCDYPLDEFKRLWQVVSTKFVPQGDGLINLRCEEHREKAAKISKKRSTAGRKGGETTKQKTQQTRQQIEQQNGQQTGQQNGGQTGGQLAAPFARPSIPSHPIPSHPMPTDSAASSADEDAPPPLDAPIDPRATPEAVIAVKLRRVNVQISSMDVIIQDWIRDGITIERLLEAVAIARLTKPREVIPARYVDKIVRDEKRMSGGGAAEPKVTKTRGESVIEEFLREQKQASEG